QSADADAANYDRTEVLAPHGAFELGFEGGYTQPFGELADGVAVGDIAKSGGAAGLNVGYRFTPRWAISLYGQFHESSVEDNLPGDVDVRGVSTGLMGTFHTRPYMVVDPYLSLGTGYRAFFIARSEDVNETLHGFQIARAMFGVDFRVSEDVALGPQVGADVNVFVADKVENRDVSSVDSVRPSTFLFAGVGGRFDIGGRRIADDDTLPVPAAGPKPARRTPSTTGIRVDQTILTTCGISTPRAYFEFDSADVQATDRSTLDLVAQCFTSGPLKGQSMRVVGHADPRGTDDYNKQLGKSRAVAVEEFLVARGVSGDKVVSESRGEADSTDDPSEFAFDRRVDIQLAK
ncbi:MAG: OmpA family protein, partial [Myxococcales bacterium]|nr:OmpA family protein [Myxococcales bacterium]